MSQSNRPRPYSTLRDGKIVWVSPEERSQSSRKRSRLETDAEVRTRLEPAIAKANASSWGLWFPVSAKGKTGAELDKMLKEYNLEPRQYVDEAD